MHNGNNNVSIIWFTKFYQWNSMCHLEKVSWGNESKHTRVIRESVLSIYYIVKGRGWVSSGNSGCNRDIQSHCWRK